MSPFLRWRRAPVALAVAFGLVLVAVSACEPTKTGAPKTPAPPVASEAKETRPTAVSSERVAPPVNLSGIAEPEDEAEIGGTYPGTDVFANPTPQALPTVVGSDEAAVTLNFVDTDLREVVKAVLGDILGINYILDPRIQGTVTLQTSRPLPRPALLPALEQILSLNDAAIVNIDDLYHVVPAAEAVHGAPLSRGDFERLRSPGYGLAVVPLQYISATEMETIIEPFAPAGAVIRMDAARNLLIIGGNRNDRANLLDLVQVFDVDWLEGMSFAVHPVQSTTAEVLVKELQSVFGEEEEGPLAGLVRFVPLERLNAVLVISPRASYLESAEIWIERLDVGEGAVARIYVYYCQNTRAQEIAAVLNQIFGSSQQGFSGPELAPGLSPVELIGDRGLSRGGGFGSSGRSGFGGGQSGFGGGRSSFGGGLAQSVQVAENGQALQAETAPEPATPPTPIPSAPAAAGPDFAREALLADAESEIRIIPDPVKNALVILATPEDYKRVEAALKKLDIESLQVLIEATFIEIALTDSLEFGTQWFFNADPSQIFFPSAAPAAVNGAFNWVLSTNGGNVQVAMRALQSVTEVNLLSSPNLLVLDNQQARIQIGDQVPVQTGEAIPGGGDTVVSTFEYRDTGTILAVTPRVNAGGLVTMELQQEVSDVGPETGVGDNPIFIQRTIESTIAIHDGESIVLGGQIFEDKDRSNSGVPWLSQVPVVGFLFGTQSTGFTKRELMVVLTPRVIRSESEAREVTDDVSRRMQNVKKELEKFRVKGSGSGT